MIKMFRYMKERWYYLVMIIALLFVQAFCDLSLPDYTSKIINVGIQQKGIEDGVLETIRAETMEQLQSFMTEKEGKQVLNAYKKEQDCYQLKKLSKDERKVLNEILCEAEISMMGISEKKLSDSMMTQGAVFFVEEEYLAQGKDMDKMQMNYLLKSGFAMLGLALVLMMAAVSVTFLSARVAAVLGRNLRNHIYRKVISFSGTELNQFSTASLITRSTNDVQQVQMLFTMLFRIVLYAPILGLGGVYKVFQTEVSMTWILALAVVVIMLFVGLLFKIAMPKFTKLQFLIDELNMVSREILTGISVIRAFSREKHEEKRFEEANVRLTKTNLFVNRCMTFMMPVMMFLMNGITILIVWNGAHAVDQGTMQVGNMVAFMQYAMQIIMAFLMITMMSIMIPRASVAAKRINEVLETEVVIYDAEHTVKADAKKKGQVVFEQVGFAYPGAEEETLHDISFTANPGETVAFIGSTGSGKSTLINLIPRFFDVTKGKILVDGVDVRQFSLKELRERIGFVPQKAVLFSGTIGSNIRYGKEEASKEEIEKAAEIAQALEFIQEKEEGMNGAISQGGTNVSGGQKQRLSIARAIAKNPEIYIFDDSFSALDYKTDVALRRALKQKTKDATTLIVAQRISTIMHADKILVLEEGRVVGIGAHKELLKTCEVYRQIAMSQLSEEELANE